MKGIRKEGEGYSMEGIQSYGNHHSIISEIYRLRGCGSYPKAPSGISFVDNFTRHHLPYVSLLAIHLKYTFT